MSKKLILLLIVLAIATSIYYKIKHSNTSNASFPSFQMLKPTPTLNAESTLVLYPSTISATPGQSTSINVFISTQGTTPTLIQLELSYDPNVVSDITITPGKFFNNPLVVLNTNDTTIGRISYALTTDQKPKLSKGIVATISFTPKTNIAGTTAINFEQKTTVSTDSPINTLTGAYGTKIQIMGTTPSPQASISGTIKK